MIKSANYNLHITNNTRNKKLFGHYLVVIVYSLTPFLVRAQDCVNDLCHPFPNTTLLEKLGASLQIVLGLVGVVAFLVVIAGAARWMTAGGNPENVDKGRNMIVWAFLGLVLAAASFVIVDFVFTGLNASLIKP